MKGKGKILQNSVRSPPSAPSVNGDSHITTEELINASGHVQELQRNFNLLSLTGIGLVVGNVWPAAGGSILVALFNGGPPGVFNMYPSLDAISNNSSQGSSMSSSWYQYSTGWSPSVSQS